MSKSFVLSEFKKNKLWVLHLRRSTDAIGFISKGPKGYTALRPVSISAKPRGTGKRVVSTPVINGLFVNHKNLGTVQDLESARRLLR